MNSFDLLLMGVDILRGHSLLFQQLGGEIHQIFIGSAFSVLFFFAFRLPLFLENEGGSPFFKQIALKSLFLLFDLGYDMWEIGMEVVYFEYSFSISDLALTSLCLKLHFHGLKFLLYLLISAGIFRVLAATGSPSFQQQPQDYKPAVVVICLDISGRQAVYHDWRGVADLQILMLICSKIIIGNLGE